LSRQITHRALSITSKLSLFVLSSKGTK
jgi:hypothetical protein